MNNKIQEFIHAKKERLESSKQAQRDKHLIKLGLIDEEKSNREYSDVASGRYPYYDRKKNKHYSEVKVALNITETEYEELCKYFPLESEEVDDLNTYENTLNTFGNITLIVGLICTLYLFFSIALIDVPFGETEFDLAGLAITLSVLLTSILTWALLRVISSISINVRQLNNKTK